MFKSLLAAAAIVSFFIVGVAPPHVAHAWDWGTITWEGTVTRPDGTPVAHVMVAAADCLNSPIDFTDANGHYHIEGSAHLCFQEPMTIATWMQYSHDLSTKDKNTLVDATTTATGSLDHVNIANLRMGWRTIPVPEFSWASSIIAVGGALGAATYIRHVRGKKALAKSI